MKKINIALVSSQGGHSGQIRIIFTQEVIGKNRAIFVTETPNSDISTKKKNFQGKYDSYFFKKDNLRFNPFKYLSAMLRLIKIYRNEEINLVITNGAQLSIPAVPAAKILGVKTIFIDTVIRVKTPNWSARACYIFSDLFFVQHKGMARKYGRRARYIGGIL